MIDSKAFFDSIGITFIYPVHGGVMGSSIATTPRLNNGTTRYDSIVFNNYETIKQLMTGDIIQPPPAQGGGSGIIILALALGTAYLLTRKK